MIVSFYYDALNILNRDRSTILDERYSLSGSGRVIVQDKKFPSR